MNNFYEAMEYIQYLIEAKKRGKISDLKIIWDHDEEKRSEERRVGKEC